MTIAGKYSLNDGERYIREHFPTLLAEVEAVIGQVHAPDHKTKTSREKTMPGRMLYSPSDLNKAFKAAFGERGWKNKKVLCNYSEHYYTPGYTVRARKGKPYRDMDFVKDKLGVEVQFGKYAFMVYNVSAKMTIFHNLGFIDAGIEVVPVKQLAEEMSTGVSYFEQFVWDLDQRGTADIDIPVLVLGIDI